MQVHCDEGVAIRIGPEPCAGIREGVGEASVGERVGQPLSREINLDPGASFIAALYAMLNQVLARDLKTK